MKKAVLFMVLSTFSFTLMNGFVKYLSHFPTFEIVFFRSIGSLVLATSYILFKGIPIMGNNKRLMLYRSFAGITAMSLFFMSLKYIPVGTAVSLRYIAPIFATFFAVILLKEKLRAVQWFLFAIAFCGVLVIKGFGDSLDTTGLLLVLTASVFSGMVYVLIRRIGKGDHPLVIVNYFMFIGTVIGGLLSINNFSLPQGNEWWLLLSLGLFGFFGQLFMTKAFQVAKTTLVAPLKYIEVIFTVTIGVYWFGDIYTITSLLGILMIVGALVTNVLVGRR
ncbi:DMT family transporter [Maribacter sp. PR1]|uniref:DMT family transporter n=1 Tax=Maribacter cobaltidurans TaxID=1178778 RepID=A0ABU7IUM2_9FLAO|nr:MULTISPECIES: DMT family transporter [Maribacter]MDC6389266.1 DMT family transporter [Maribacter sp. PR1]MEE1976654.1 DMT family transporter [Maribacter cobaltidurans]